MMERVAASPNLKARIAGVFYLLTFLTGGFALLVRSRVGVAAGLVAGVCYIAVTLIFYDLFKPVDKRLSFLAATVSAVGIAAGPLGLTRVNPLVFFGFYCLLIGYLIFRSTFLPKALGVLMALASLGWLTFSIAAAREVAVPLQSGARPDRGRSADPLAPRGGRGRSKRQIRPAP